jgi:TonB family protein
MKAAKKNQTHSSSSKSRLRSVSFLIISALLHILLLASFYISETFFKNNTPVLVKQETTPDIQFLDITALDNGKLVEQSEDEKANKKPKDAKFVSKVDKSVDKETRAPRHGEFQNKQTQAATSQQFAPPPPPQAPSETAKTEKSDSSSEPMKTFENGDIPVVQNEKQEPQKKVTKAKTVADLRPNTMQEMSANSMLSQTSDHLKDVTIGAETHLNTREFLYYSYFNRIKKKLRQHWEPMVHAKVRSMVKKGREIASVETTLSTRVIITLDESGVLRRVQVATTSGLEDLDDAAVEALQEAAQFPNPPKDLVREGFVTLNWDFILES